ncbi:hypothetical protein [Streptomyces sp. NPDC048508]
MGSATPVTDAERERVRELHAAGNGRREIATGSGVAGMCALYLAAISAYR